MEALALAGGLQESAGYMAVVFQASRDGAPARRVPVSLEQLARGTLGQSISLQPGDVLHAPEAGRILVTGLVEHAEAITLRQRTTVLDALALSGGVNAPRASPSLTRIRRRTPAGAAFVDVDLDAVEAGEAEDPVLQPGDILEVRQGWVRAMAFGFYDMLRGIVSFGYNLASLVP